MIFRAILPCELILPIIDAIMSLEIVNRTHGIVDFRVVKPACSKDLCPSKHISRRSRHFVRRQ